MPKQPKSDAELAEPHFQHPQPQSQGNPAKDQVFIPTQPSSDELQAQITNLQSKRVNFNTDIIGVVETIGMAPTTSTPTSPFQQFKIFNGFLYFYDTLNKIWDIAGSSTHGSVYPGAVLSGGTAGTPFPSGWSVSHIGTGDYKITHNLGTTNYALTCTLFASTGLIINFNNQNSNDVEVFIKNTSGTATDATFYFILATP